MKKIMIQAIASLLLAICLIMLQPISNIQADEIERTDDFDAFAETFTSASGETLFNNYYDSLASTSNLIQPLSLKLNSDTKITWLATYHENVFELDKENMVIVISQIDPKVKGAKKTINSYSYKAKSYGISTSGNGIIDNHYFVVTPNVVFPKGEYVISVRSGDSYFSGIMDMNMITLLEDLDEYMSHYTWIGNTSNANPSRTTGSLSIKGVAGTLPKKVLPVETTNTMNLNTLQKEIKKIKDAAFQAYIQSDEYKQAWALVEEELVRVQAYNQWLATQQKIKEANKPITLIVNSYTIPTSVAPVKKNGKILVPIRALCDALDCSVAYNSKTKTIKIADNATGTILIIMTIGNRTASVITPSGWYDDRVMDVSPQIINGATMVPVSFIAKAMNFVVEWSAPTKTLRIISGGEG